MFIIIRLKQDWFIYLKILEDFVYSSASDYAVRNGYLDDVVIFEYFG